MINTLNVVCTSYQYLTVGDAWDCSVDPPCDGVTKEPNDQHTECGLYFLSVFVKVGL